VLPVGGIKEKILAARRAGIKEIILCRNNKKDISEIDDHYLANLKFHFVNSVDELIDLALMNETVSDPLVFDIREKLSQN
jgi:ATP-dependent Lon protease